MFILLDFINAGIVSIKGGETQLNVYDDIIEQPHTVERMSGHTYYYVII